MQQGQQSVAKTDGHKSPRVHVETIRKKHGGKVYEQYLLRSSYREGGKVKHRTLGASRETSKISASRYERRLARKTSKYGLAYRPRRFAENDLG